MFEDFQALAAAELPRQARVYGTFLSPMLTVIQSAPKPLGEALKAKLKEMRRSLQRRYRADLDDMRLFFRLGGLPSDPFR
jgi:chorismate-pyruvate lyase